MKTLLLAAWLTLAGLNTSAQTDQKLGDAKKHIYSVLDNQKDTLRKEQIGRIIDRLDNLNIEENSNTDGSIFADGYDVVQFDEKWDDIIIEFEKLWRYTLTVVLGKEGKINFTSVENIWYNEKWYKKFDNQPMSEELKKRFYNEMIKLFNSAR